MSTSNVDGQQSFTQANRGNAEKALHQLADLAAKPGLVSCSRSAVAHTRSVDDVLQVPNSLGCASRHTMEGASAASA
jgi:hypothetical protein